jgi:HlyD family secretion protein
MSLGAGSKAHDSIRRHLAGGVTCVVLLGGGVGGWATTAEIAGAVIAPGAVVVDSNVKKVQHPTGGVVGELRVRDGDHVRSGEMLLRLDETQTRSNLAIITRALDELAARQARDVAERDGFPVVRFPADLLVRRTTDPLVRELLDGEERLFTIRFNGRQGQKAQLRNASDS